MGFLALSLLLAVSLQGIKWRLSVGGGGVTIQKEPGSLSDGQSKSFVSCPLPTGMWGRRRL